MSHRTLRCLAFCTLLAARAADGPPPSTGETPPAPATSAAASVAAADGQATPLAADAPKVPKRPDPARFAKSFAEFAAQDEKTPAPRGAVVMTGSSSMRMWHRRLAQDMAPLTVVARGFGGSTMFDLDHYLDRAVLAYAPRAVVIYEGDNDLQLGFTAEEVLAATRGVVERIHAADAATRIYFLATKPSPSRVKVWPEMQRYNRLVADYCATQPNTVLIDTATPLLGPEGAFRPELYKEDRLHLSDAGYDVWREVVRAVLVAAEAPHEAPRP